MARRISLLLSLLSTALLLATLTFWYRSRHHVDIATFCTPAGYYQGLAAQHGGVLLFFSTIPGGKESAWETHHASTTTDDQQYIDFRDSLFAPPAERFSHLGFRLAGGILTLTPQLITRYTVLALPYWFLVIVFGILPLGPFRAAWQRHKRRRRGLCLACGYDIRASTDRCPECGAAIPERSTPAVAAGKVD
ncbi:MAG TPA: hypothetical protein VG269_23845 [Tepidisphaeraceae bacterium]|jgi:hypothetical protein|nr:hypothetical protein [Tepidisphaeraceae bacterium]